MRGNSSISSFKNVPWGAVCCVLIVLLLELFYFHSGRFIDMLSRNLSLEGGNRHVWSLVNFQRHLSRIGRQDPVIPIFGTSQVEQAFNTGYLNRVFADTGYRTQKLFYYAGRPPLFLPLVEEMVSKSPPAIIYMPTIASFNEFGDMQLDRMRYLCNGKAATLLFRHVDLSLIFEHRRSLGEAFLGALLPAFRHQFGLRWMTDRQLRRAAGFEEPQGPPGREADKPWPAFEKNRFTAYNRAAFSAICERIVGAGIPLIVIDGPVRGDVLKGPAGAARKAEHDAFLREQAGAIGFDYYGERELPEFSVEDFSDLTHFNRRGRHKITFFVRDLLIEKFR
jgi:hypothetical protein